MSDRKRCEVCHRLAGNDGYCKTHRPAATLADTLEEVEVSRGTKRKHPLFRDNFIPEPKGFVRPEEKSEFGILKKDFGSTTKWGDR